MFVYLILVIPAMLFTMWAQWRVKSSFDKWSKVRSAKNLNGMDVARTLMQNEGLSHVQIERIDGFLTDHYDPRDKVMRLSDGSLQPTVAAMAIVAHELGHAAQDREEYFWLRARSSIVGAANIGTNLGSTLFFVGMLLAIFSQRLGVGVAILGVVFFSAAVAFTLVTLPVEFNASSRARDMLMRNGLVTVEESNGVNAVLNAAALTYVAAAAQAVAQLLYFISILMRRR
ncbi:MAG: zinc metallopeptidase [Candidatus Viridilinea halotolerans]|uniref:Zinc metallopeptidase n=1 Tax=Candidatus Viridilinea halotolerans TaxID=2491704 RepID=A0A426U3V5_9CHLR|nr:MAG: zinc metallopeptidase [Candidatus Viridilinea halotolerans]